MKYWLFQIPGWIVLAIILALLVRWDRISVGLALGLFALWLVKDALLYPLLRPAYEPGHRRPADRLVGERAVVTAPLGPSGYVQLHGELWRATLREPGGTVPPGGRVIVRAVDGLTVIVEPEPAPAAGHPIGS